MGLPIKELTTCPKGRIYLINPKYLKRRNKKGKWVGIMTNLE